MHISTELPEFWNLRERYEATRLTTEKRELPGVGADLVPPVDWGGEDASGGNETFYRGVLSSVRPPVVNVLSPASDGPGPALGARAQVVVNHHHIVVRPGSG